jgi:hypothetical protein
MRLGLVGMQTRRSSGELDMITDRVGPGQLLPVSRVRVDRKSHPTLCPRQRFPFDYHRIARRNFYGDVGQLYYLASDSIYLLSCHVQGVVCQCETIQGYARDTSALKRDSYSRHSTRPPGKQNSLSPSNQIYPEIDQRV